jgi:hypothetical protein
MDPAMTTARVNGPLLDGLDSNDPDRRHLALQAVTDFVRMTMLESGWQQLPGVSTLVTADPNPADPLCVVEGVIPFYRADAAGEEDVRDVLRRRIAEAYQAREGQACTTT